MQVCIVPITCIIVMQNHCVETHLGWSEWMCWLSNKDLSYSLGGAAWYWPRLPSSEILHSWFTVDVANVGTALAVQAWNKHPFQVGLAQVQILTGRELSCTIVYAPYMHKWSHRCMYHLHFTLRIIMYTHTRTRYYIHQTDPACSHAVYLCMCAWGYCTWWVQGVAI